MKDYVINLLPIKVGLKTWFTVELTSGCWHIFPSYLSFLIFQHTGFPDCKPSKKSSSSQIFGTMEPKFYGIVLFIFTKYLIIYVKIWKLQFRRYDLHLSFPVHNRYLLLNYIRHIFFHKLTMKFIYYEKGTKIWRNLQTFLWNN